jgi:phage baseplate assembly protein W
MDRGSDFALMKHRHIHSDMVNAMANQSASGAIAKWEPRVRVTRVAVTLEENTQMCHVTYQPLGYLRTEEQTVIARI